jgi:hypothetical protein
MAVLADAFVRGSAEEGDYFDYAVEDAPSLDAWVDLFLEEQPSEDVVRSVIMSMGAFVGELIVRNGGGNWDFDEASGPSVRLNAGLVCFPFNKVGKRLALGQEHSLAQFIDAAMTGALPPEARPTEAPGR